MKINRLDAHDRLQHFKKTQNDVMSEGIEECRLRNPNSIEMQRYFPYIYIFSHPRSAEDGVTKRMIWQPRLLKPIPQTNSYCFRLTSNTDLIEIIWMLPPREMWEQYEKGKMLENENVIISIQNFTKHKKELSAPHPDDWPEEKIREKLEWIKQQHDWEKKGYTLI